MTVLAYADIGVKRLCAIDEFCRCAGVQALFVRDLEYFGDIARQASIPDLRALCWQRGYTFDLQSELCQKSLPSRHRFVHWQV